MTKAVFALMVMALLVTVTCIAGCTSPAPAAAPAPAAPVAPPTAATSTAIPALTGIWTGTYVGHTRLEGFVDDIPTRYNITAQKGRAFTGQKEYTRMDGKSYTEGFSGIVTGNNEIFMGDHGTGYIEGRQTGTDSMELYYIDEGSDAKAFIIQLNRQKN